MFNVIKFALLPHPAVLWCDADEVAVLKDMKQMLFSCGFLKIS